MHKAFNVAVLVLGLAAGFIAPANADPSVNLIQNGDFETGTLSPWTASGNLDIGTIPYFGGGSTAANGSYIVAFNDGDRAPNAVLSQTFATQAGVQYTVAYSYGSNDGTQQSITASVADDQAATLAAAFTTSLAGDTSLEPFSFVFTADSASSTLSFADFSGNPTISTDGLLDNVSVTAIAVPEPASAALLAFGLASFGAARRRRAMV